MGRSKKRHAAFLAANPTCCFCGGTQPATTEDHFPPRAMFRDRTWPEGYVFPACESCNGATAKDELLVAMLGRVLPDSDEPKHRVQLENLMKSVNNNFPGLLESMRMSANEKKKWLKENGIAIPAGTASADIGIFSAADPRIDLAMQRFATKLFLALLYFQSKQILTKAGGIVFKWVSNERSLDEVFPKEVLEPLLVGFPSLKRAQTSLDDQFSTDLPSQIRRKLGRF